jgi:hypothetical protein
MEVLWLYYSHDSEHPSWTRGYPHYAGQERWWILDLNPAFSHEALFSF